MFLLGNQKLFILALCTLFFFLTFIPETSAYYTGKKPERSYVQV